MNKILTLKEEKEAYRRYGKMNEIIDSLHESGDYEVSTYFRYEDGKEFIYLESKMFCSVHVTFEKRTFKNMFCLFRKPNSKIRKMIFMINTNEINEDFYIKQNLWIQKNSKHKDFMVKRKNY